MYDSIAELPTQVKAALDEAAQICWMKSYNHHLEQSHDPDYSNKMAWHFVAKKADSRFVSGPLSREVIDDQREKLNQDTVYSELNKMFKTTGVPMHDLHSNRPVGVWFDAALEEVNGIRQVRAFGMVNKGLPYYDEFWDQVKGKKMGHLSIGIMKIDPKFQCDAHQCWKQVDQLQVFEGSIVPRGSCPGTKMDDINFGAKGYKEELAMGMKVELEHGTVNPETNITNDDPVMTAKIAQAHLNEIHDYYTRLAKMESEAKMENKSNPGEGDTIAQLPTAPQVEEKCHDDVGKLANKDTLGLGDAGVEALQKIIMLVSEGNKRLADLDAKLSSHITSEESAEGAPGETSDPSQKQEPSQNAPTPAGEKKGDEPEKDKDDKNANKAAVEVADKSNAIVPPMPPTSPASPDDIHPVGMTESAETPVLKKDLEDVAALQERKKMAEKEGATTPRPESAAQDQGASPKKDALTALLDDTEKLRKMSAMDIERFVSKYAKGEL